VIDERRTSRRSVLLWAPEQSPSLCVFIAKSASGTQSPQAPARSLDAVRDPALSALSTAGLRFGAINLVW
jgi:hypothetical protein